MTAVNSVRVRISVDEDAWLELAVIPHYRTTEPPTLIDASAQSSPDDLAPIQLLESVEYRYRFELPGDGPIETSRPEVFEPDDRTGRTGRLKTGLSVGLLPIEVFRAGSRIGTISLEVRSRKLNYRTEYQWMLRDIAEVVAEVVMERFGTAEHRFAPDEAGDSRSAYQRFAFLKALLESDEFFGALRQVTDRPYVAWNAQSEQRFARRGAVGSGRLARELTRHMRGPRARLAGDLSLPERIEVSRQAETLDNLPNRFIAFALRRWLQDVDHIADALTRSPASPQARRGLREIEAVRNQLEEVLSHSVLREVGTIAHIPTNSTVLLTRPGYRDVYRAFIEFEMAAKLGWPGGEFVYGAGQKNVATLYEYWTFIQLAKALANVSGGTFSLNDLIDDENSQLGIKLARGEARCLRGTIKRQGREIGVQLWFNLTFSEGKSSWSQTMRPDCSLLLTPRPSYARRNAAIWLHFDAKYRVESIKELFQREDEPAGSKQSRREDVIKMHAYRDAIRRSAGAYILYPGDRPESFREFHELLPGLGAFALRPSDGGLAKGEDALTRFLDAVLDHAASPSTQHERSRYWSEQVFAGPRESGAGGVAVLTRPPADTLVLLCFAKSAEHMDWIGKNRLYNIRADHRAGSLSVGSSELGSEFALVYAIGSPEAQIYRVAGEALILSGDALRERQYPEPRGTAYLCLPLERVDLSDVSFTSVAVAALARRIAGKRPIASPLQTTWSQLVETTNQRDGES